MVIKGIVRSELPRERMERLGAKALSTPELLALILQSGTSKRDVLGLADALCREGLQNLSRMDCHSLRRFDGIGRAKACKLAAVMEISRRTWKESETKVLNSPLEAARIFAKEMEGEEREVLIGIFLSKRARIDQLPNTLSQRHCGAINQFRHSHS